MMNLISTVVLVSSLPLIQAQFNYNTGSSTTTAAAASTTATAAAIKGVHVVNAGQNGGFSYSPSSLNVAVGEKVEFHFFPPEHSVVQGSFDDPCHPSNGTGFFSGFVTGNQESVRFAKP
jgi:plastocyanin